MGTKGRFITLEGIDGAGKTCNLPLIKSLLEQAGKTVFCTREPGGTILGEDIRALLLQYRQERMEVATELLLLAAARVEHLAKSIIPALTRGEWVLCDRFSDATYAYQGGGRMLDVEIIRTIENLLYSATRPHLTLLFDIPVSLGQARTGNRNLANHFDQEATVFFQRVRNTYLEIAAAEPKRVRIIDASRPLILVQEEITNIINDLLSLDTNPRYFISTRH